MATRTDPPEDRLEPTIFSYIRRFSWRQQVNVLVMTLISLPFFYLWVDLPKTIVDDALGGGSGERSFYGLELSQVDYLVALCLMFLALVIINGAFKYVINVYKGIVGERMLRRLRYDLYSRVLRFPLPHFRRVSQGELVQMINAEVEPLGGFIGDAYALPAYQGGMLLTILVFMFVQDPLMGIAAIIFYPVQIYFIPKLQAQVNALGKQRVRQVRRNAENISETSAGVTDIRANDAGRYVRARFSEEVGKIFFIRFEIYKKKFFIKFLNNFLAQLAPFFFYLIGGYLVLQGNMTIGAILAIIAAHEKLASPWKELLTYYQLMADANIKYDQVVNQFDPPNMVPLVTHEGPPPPDFEVGNSIIARNLSRVEDGETAFEDLSFQIQLPSRVAIIGDRSTGPEALGVVLAGLDYANAGRLLLGESDLRRLPQSVTGRRLAYVGNPAVIFAGSLRDNLVFGLQHRPPALSDSTAEMAARRHLEAVLSGSSLDDSAADWVDYEEAGCDSSEGLNAKLIDVLRQTNLLGDVYNMGLRQSFDPDLMPEVAKRILETRVAMTERLEADPGLNRLVERFRTDAFNQNASLGENLLFGIPRDDAFAVEHLAENPKVLAVLDAMGLSDRLRRVGFELAETMVELFADLSPDHEYFRQFSFIDPEELPDYRALVNRTDPNRLDELAAEDRQRLLALPFKLIPAKHRLGLLDEDLQAEIVVARGRLRQHLGEKEAAQIAFFDADRLNRLASIQDNILFGRISYGQANAAERVSGLIAQLIDERGLRPAVVEVGLGAQVGVGGVRLSVPQRQKLAIARALVRRPDILILNNTAAALERVDRLKLRDNLLDAFRDRSLIWVHEHPEWIDKFDQVLVLREGRLVAVGPVEEVKNNHGAIAGLAAAE